MQENEQKNSPIKGRILQYLKIKGITPYRFYIDSGVTRNILTQANGISEDTMSRFLDYALDISPTWLLTGQGQMLKQTAPNPEPEPVILNATPPKSGYIAVPLVDIEAAAGFGVTNADYIDQSQLLYFPDTMLRGGGDRLCIGVVGESMMPTLHEDTHVVVRRLHRAEWESGILNNNIYVITTRNGESYIKRVKNRLKTDGVITLLSDNQNQRKYKPFDLSAEELHHIWVTELFISDTVVNCADYITTDNDISELREKVADLATTVEDLVQKASK